MRVAGKVWGKTEELFSNSAFELHRIEANRGHRCSKHRHATKFNAFYVENGRLEITVWQPTGTVDVTVLGPGAMTVVPPGVFHQFRAIDTTIAFEWYWTELRADDIEREDVGE
jgi:mannose-6-phosphate isomerase-like protein (cupin superfamily)